jgi:hypothetical protein
LPEPIIEAACWAHGRRKFFVLAHVTAKARSRAVPLVAVLEDWMRAERAKLFRHAEVAKAMDYALKRWASFTRFLDDGRICLTNNAAERELRSIALGRKAWLFTGSDRGSERAAIMYTLIQTAHLNGVDPRHGSLMCLPASTITKSPALPRCCHRTGHQSRSVVDWRHEHCRYRLPQDHARRCQACRHAPP